VLGKVILVWIKKKISCWYYRNWSLPIPNFWIIEVKGIHLRFSITRWRWVVPFSCHLINQFIVKTKVRVMPDGGIPTWCGGDLVILLVFPPGCQSCCYCNVMIEVSFLIDCGRNGRPAIELGVHKYCSRSSHGLECVCCWVNLLQLVRQISTYNLVLPGLLRFFVL